MAILALYVPKPEELTASLFALVVAFIVLCGFAYRLNLRIWVAAPVMLIGMMLSLSPDLIQLWNTDLGEYGNMARDWSSTDHSDTFFAITSYLRTGRGNLVAFGGMGAALAFHASVIATIRRRRVSNSNDGDTTTDSLHPKPQSP